MKCALCQNTNKLCKSHIIPEFFYKQLYDKKHRFKAIYSIWEKIVFRYKGFRERLLCEDCEKKLSCYEKYLSETLLKQYPEIMKMKVKDILNFNINYKESRLCYLSILWRMSIATTRFFKNFSIPAYEAKLKDLINRDDPGNPNEFGCVAIASFINGSFKRDWLIDPHLAKMNGDNICFVVFGGIIYIFFITFTPTPKKAPLFKAGMKWEVEILPQESPVLQNGVWGFTNNQNAAKAFIQKDNKWLITAVDVKEIPFLWYRKV